MQQENIYQENMEQVLQNADAHQDLYRAAYQEKNVNSHENLKASSKEEEERYCADLSWLSKEPYPFVLPDQRADLYTQWTQLSCFEYLRNTTVVFLDNDPPRVVPWTRDTVTVTTGGALQPSASRDLNPDHDLVQQEVRYYWSVDRQVLLSSSTYERLFWPLTGPMNCSSNQIASVTRSFSTSTVDALSQQEVRLLSNALQQYSDSDGQLTDAPSTTDSTAARFPSPDRRQAALLRQQLYSSGASMVSATRYERIFVDQAYAWRVLEELGGKRSL
jgi:hypothetical protein